MRNIQKIRKSGKTLEEAVLVKSNFQKKYYDKHKRDYYEMEINKLKEMPFYTRQNEVWDKYVSLYFPPLCVWKNLAREPEGTHTINEGDRDNPLYKCKYVCRGFRVDEDCYSE